MSKQDTIDLLKECDSGTKMATASIDEVLDKVGSCRMKNLLTDSKDHHKKLEGELDQILREHCSKPQDPSPVAKSMSWLKTNVKLGMDGSDKMIADVMIDGCNMGVKSLHKYLNQYEEADHTAKDICKRLISMEEELGKELRAYL